MHFRPLLGSLGRSLALTSLFLAAASAAACSDTGNVQSGNPNPATAGAGWFTDEAGVVVVRIEDNGRARQVEFR